MSTSEPPTQQAAHQSFHHGVVFTGSCETVKITRGWIFLPHRSWHNRESNELPKCHPRLLIVPSNLACFKLTLAYPVQLNLAR